MRSLYLLVGLLVACGSGDDGRHPAVPNSGGNGGTGGNQARAGSEAMPEAGQAGDTSEPTQGGAAGEGGSAGEPPIIYEMGGLPQNMPGVCDSQMKLGEEQAIALAVPDATLLGMTPDELTLVFTTGQGDTLALYVADRATSGADFAERAVAVPDDYSVATGAALSSDGLQLIVARADGSGLAELTRPARDSAFEAELNEARFAKINALKPMSGRSVGWPVLSKDGKTLYYVSYYNDARVFQSSLVGSGFEIGQGIDEFTLGGPSGKFKLLSGLASDQRAIFFMDQATKHATALFRSRDGAPFYDPLDLGERQGSVPNSDCTRVYSTVAGELVFQARE